MAKRLINLKIEHVAGVDKPANKRKFLVVKAEKPEGTMLTKEQIAKIGDKDAMEAVVKQQEEILELEKKVKAQDDEIAKLKATPPAPPSDDDEALWKGIPPTVRNRFDAIKKERDDMQKEAKDEKDKRETAHWTSKSRAFQYVQVTPEHFGKIMKNVAEHAPEEAEEIMRVLGAADDMIGKGALFSEFGKSRNTNPSLGDATNVTSRVLALADDYVKLDKGLSRDMAIQKVFREHPEWYPSYRYENRTDS